MAATRNYNLDVYSGTFGRLRLSDTSSVLHDIFLYTGNPTWQIPVPSLYYKILVNNAEGSGIVLIGEKEKKYFS